MQKRSPLGLILAILIGVALVAGAYLFLMNNGTGGEGGEAGNDPGALPTTIPDPPAKVYEAVSDIPANRLLRASDEELFAIVEIEAAALTPDDITIDEFNSVVIDRVTLRAIQGGNRLKESDFRDAGLAEQIPTPAPGQASRKIMTVFIPGMGDIASSSSTVDIVASYQLTSKYMRFSSSTNENGVLRLVYVDEDYADVSTKVIAQDVPVLRVIAPVIPADQAGGAAAPPTTPVDPAATIGPPPPTAVVSFGPDAIWEVQLAVTDQEAELIEYTAEKFGSLALIVRGAEDRELARTTGVTMDLLMRIYAVAQPYAQPNMLVDLVKAPPVPQPPAQPPVVIPIPFPFGSGSSVPLPTTEPLSPTLTPTP